MTPAPGNHEARRHDVSEAVWRVLVKDGFVGLRLRAVAEEMQASTGLLTHYFPNKRALLRHALEVLEQRTQKRGRRAAPTDGTPPPAEGLAMLRAVVLDMLPLTPDSTTSNRIWVGAWDAALTDPESAADHARRYERSRQRLGQHIAAAQLTGELPNTSDPQHVAATVHAFVLGLVVQALFAPEQFPPERQIAMTDDFLSHLSHR